MKKMNKYEWSRSICSALILIIISLGAGCDFTTWQFWTIWILSWSMVFFTDLNK